tara:strand:- start:2730 stop:3290 length:561 start_codon:yes stop_codon:yes gene_type:complete
MNRFTIKELPLKGLLEIRQTPIIDNRGFLSRLFCKDEFSEFGFKSEISQINHTHTKEAGSIRGMHFQYPPATESKLVTCLKGAVFDVAVDIRKGSPTFLEWHAIELSFDKHNALLIPKGFAHGFQTLVKDVELLYFHDHEYNNVLESGLNPHDPSIKIKWPKKTKLISEKDFNRPSLASINFGGIL